MRGRTITVRFGYDYVLGLSFYNQSDPGFGWYLDDISFSGTEELTNPVVTNIAPGTSFYFVPAQAGDYSLDVRAQVYDRYYLEWGPAKRVTAILAAVPMLQFSGTPAVSGNQVQIDFTVSNYRSDMFFQLLSAPDPGGAWTPTTITSLQTVVPNSKFRLTTSTGGASKMFYRVQSN